MGTVFPAEEDPVGYRRHGHEPQPVTSRSLAIFPLAIFLLFAFALQTQPAAKKSPTPTQGSITFEDVTRAAGIDFHLTCGGSGCLTGCS